MEMHQVRYFLALADTQNFTRAAEACHVAQPSLTRAIKQLECEFGGDLFLRERPVSQLTELGQRMRPFLQQCYTAASDARAAANSYTCGDVGTLKLALSRSIDLSLVTPFLGELARIFKGVEFKFQRGNAEEVAEAMRKGEAELGIAAARSAEWERLDVWPLFSEAFDFAVARTEPRASDAPAVPADFRQRRFVQRTYCEHAGEIGRRLSELGIGVGAHEVSCERDLMRFVQCGYGVAALPRSTPSGAGIRRVALEGFDLRRTVFLYGIAGRQRSAIASTMAKMMRAADWSKVDTGLNT